MYMKKDILYKRNCPRCNSELLTNNKHFFIKSEKNKTLCRKCCLIGKPKSAEHRLNMSKNHANVFGKNNPFYGKQHSAEALEKMRLANLGQNRHSDEEILKRKEKYKGAGNPFFGKTHTASTRKKMGMKKTPEHLKKLSLANKGRKSPMKGKKHTCEAVKKMRLSAIKRMEKTFGSEFSPNVNPRETNYFDKLEREMGWCGIYYGKNGDKRQHCIKELGYYVDFYDPHNNIVVEYDETRHYDKNWNLSERDIKRQNEIKKSIRCKFYRYNEALDIFYEI